ncbi:FtsX-like permease family protein [Thermosporothrix hazakensis]|jgi:cell division protein FtsX|uniref:FtsX-like permease family protein n=1 Tax=Thermosporothrix hazakensis TaxID=644383 RepID=A0A326TSQ5_THEHA|nr:ABC transporter permease [Thermosporothrix hazakensis]PZW19494.1 FtsX-like permease family protein [Thermosporothrix hazakensis]
MWKVLFQAGGRRPWFAASGFLIAACAFLLLNITTQMIVFQSRQVIGQNWRSTYDLVVLSPGSTQGEQVVPPDHLVSLHTGISMAQYEQIKRMAGVEVAAPISFIGNARFPMPTVRLGYEHMLPGFYTLTWTIRAFDGVKEYKEYQRHSLIYGGDVPCDGGVCEWPEQTKKELQQLGVDTYFSVRQGKYFTGMPHPGTFLLAAIDPDAENRLVHLNRSITQGEPLPQQKQLDVYSDLPKVLDGNGEERPNYIVPVLVNQELPQQVTVQASFEKLKTSSGDPHVLLQQNAGNTLQKASVEQILFQGKVPTPQSDVETFMHGVDIEQEGSTLRLRTSEEKSFALNFLSRPTNLQYQLMREKGPDGKSAYQVVPMPQETGSWDEYEGKNLAVRPLEPFPDVQYEETITYGELGSGSYTRLGYAIYNDAAYMLKPQGAFDWHKLSASFRDALNWLPETTYTPVLPTLRYDAQGRPIAPKQVLPTTNPQGLSLQSPLALTTLTAARQILGENCINVIRVRVAGNVTPDEEGWKRVAQVAQKIHEKTGLQALVTLGSSPRPTLVYVPGIKEGVNGYQQTVEPLGWIEERWISIGVGMLYLNQIGVTQNILLGGVLLVCLGYLIVTLSSLMQAQRHSFAILSAIGWKPWHPPLVFLGQVLLLALSGGIVGIGLALAIAAGLGAAIPWEKVVWTLPGIVLLALLSVSVPMWQLWRIKPGELLRQGAIIVRERKQERKGVFRWPLLGMAMRSVMRARWRTWILLGSLFCSSCLLLLTLHGIVQFRATLQGTLLGDYVLLQTAVPQICAILFTTLLAILSLADLLVMQVQQRRKEIGVLRALGWYERLIQRQFLTEGCLLALTGVVPGVLVATGVLLVQRQMPPLLVFASLLGVVFALLLLGVLLGILPALRAIRRLSLLNVLRAE